jgi:hypothetical protein
VIEQFQLPRLRALPKEVRIFAGLVMLVLAVGYAHAIVYVYVTTRIVPKGIEERYRGSEQTALTPSPAGTAVDTSDITTRSADTPVAQPNSEQTKTRDAEYHSHAHTHDVGDLCDLGSHHALDRSVSSEIAKVHRRRAVRRNSRNLRRIVGNALSRQRF